MKSQINELSKGEKAKANTTNRYNLGSKKNEGKSNILDQPLIAKNPAKPATNTAKEKKTKNLSSKTKDPIPAVK
jgi:hypothetical protein